MPISTIKHANGNRNSCMNYVSYNAVCILDVLNNNSIAPIIGNLNHLINSSPKFDETAHKLSTKIKSPYDLPSDFPLIDLYLNSPDGGDMNAYLTILGLLNKAKHKGIIIRTNVFGFASGYTSMLAIQGTPGYRIVSEDSKHFIGYELFNHSYHNEAGFNVEAKTKYYLKDIQNIKNAYIKTYLKNVTASKEEIRSLMADKIGLINTKDCLNLGLCDWILTNEGKLKKR